MKKLLHFLSRVLVWVLFALEGGALLYANLLKDTQGPLRHFYIEDTAFTAAATGCVMLILVLIYLGTFGSARPRLRNISFDSEGGAVSISVNAVSDFIRKLGDEFGAVISLEPKIRSEKDLISIDLDVKIQTGTRIPELSQLLQDRVRESIRDGLGIIEVREIKVHIREIVGAPPPSQAV